MFLFVIFPVPEDNSLLSLTVRMVELEDGGLCCNFFSMFPTEQLGKVYTTGKHLLNIEPFYFGIKKLH